MNGEQLFYKFSFVYEQNNTIAVNINNRIERFEGIADNKDIGNIFAKGYASFKIFDKYFIANLEFYDDRFYFFKNNMSDYDIYVIYLSFGLKSQNIIEYLMKTNNNDIVNFICKALGINVKNNFPEFML